MKTAGLEMQTFHPASGPGRRPVRRIAILCEAGREFVSGRYAIDLMMVQWNRMGIETIVLSGVTQCPEADLVFVHVDQSVVARSYTDLAAAYPRAINQAATDIRKRRYIDGLLDRGSDHDGPVIVKTDLNYGGAPERSRKAGEKGLLQRIGRKAAQLTGAGRPAMCSKKDYFVAPCLRDVPRRYFSGDYVVQKFCPERDGDAFILREYIFLGDCHFENVERSGKAIFEEDENISLRPFTPHPRLLETRRRLGLDYGKIDYSLIDGEPFIFDANKTLGRGIRDGAAVEDMFARMAWSLVGYGRP